MNRTRALIVTTIGVASTIALVGCSDTLDAKKGEDAIAKAVRIQAGVPVQTVTCPTDVEVKKGVKFTCVVTAKDGTKGKVAVVQKDDEGNVSFNAPFLHVDENEAAIAEQIQAQAKNARDIVINCPDIVVTKRGSLFVCEGQARGETFVVRARQTDSNGRFRFKTSAK